MGEIVDPYEKRVVNTERERDLSEREEK